VGRLPRASLAFFAALGLSGCLLFTDPINKAPVVTITQVTDPVVRGIPAYFTATVTDDKDSQASMTITWAWFNPKLQGCEWITASAWSQGQEPLPLASSATYSFTADSLDAVCICAQATDHNGAMGVGCSTPITPGNLAQIIDVSGAPSGPPQRPLCSQVHLSAEGSTFLPGDQFNWSIKYTGDDPTGKSVQLSPCAGVVAAKADLHRCFYAGSKGTATAGDYTVTFSITDSVVQNGSTATFDIPVAADTPPCLQRTDPDDLAQLILVSSSPGLDGTYQSRLLTVMSVKDDCEPFPQATASTMPETQFVWSVFDATQAKPSWVRQTNTSNIFRVSQDVFLNARPGDSVRVRAEVRDSAVQQFYQSGGTVCSMVTTDRCCGNNIPCGKPDDCVRWTTWTVQFLP
jgi:hypothetical protein